MIRSIGNGWNGEHLEDWTGPGATGLRVYGTNGHGDVTWTAGSTGSVTGTVRYDPFGNATSVTGSVPDFRFQGSWADDTTKLSWVVTRWYAPAQGDFISEDSLLGQPRDPDSRHLYAYGQGDPIGRWDPTGQDNWWYRDRSRFIHSDTVELPSWYDQAWAVSWAILAGASFFVPPLFMARLGFVGAAARTAAWQASTAGGVAGILFGGVTTVFAPPPPSVPRDRAVVYYYATPLRRSSREPIGNVYTLTTVWNYYWYDKNREALFYRGTGEWQFAVTQTRGHFGCHLINGTAGFFLAVRHCLYWW